MGSRHWTIGGVSLALATGLMLGGAASASAVNDKTRDAIVRELGSIAKRAEGLRRIAPDSKDAKKDRLRVQAGTIDLERAKLEMVRTHLEPVRVYGMRFVPLFLRLERLDQELTAAQRAAGKKFDKSSAREVKKFESAVSVKLFTAGELVGELKFGPGDGFNASSVPLDARTDLDIIEQDLRNMRRGFLKGRIGVKALKKRIGKVAAAKHSMLRRHFSSEGVCGVPFDIVFRQLECIDVRLQLARRAAKKADRKSARRHLARAASCARALQANFLSFPPG